MRSIQRSFAAAGSTVRTIGTVGLQVVQLDVVGNVLGIRNTAAVQAGVLGQILEVLGQCQTDALCQSTVEVAVNQQLVQDGADVSDSGEFLNLDLTGLGVNTDFG